MVVGSPILQAKIEELAHKRVETEEAEGDFVNDVGTGSVLHDKRREREQEIQKQLTEVAELWTDQMICKMESNKFIRGAYYLATQLLTRAYHQGIHVSSEEVLRLRSVAEQAAKKNQSIIFLPCHRSHVDYVSLQLICYRLGLALPTVVAGDNLNFPVVGPFLQHAGGCCRVVSCTDMKTDIEQVRCGYGAALATTPCIPPSSKHIWTPYYKTATT